MDSAAGNEMAVKQDLAVVAEVRRFVRLITGQWGMDDFVPCLVTSELVTNALRYASASDDDVFIVDRFCRRWGVRPVAGNAGKVVFAVLDPS
jgi:hypothetical protein